MKKLIALLTTAILASTCITSCGSKKESGHRWENLDTLNEWQMNLLEAQELPTDIEKLTPTQKRSIQHIYEMITYLNEKYDEEFVYAGYIEPGLMQEEELFAYPKQYGADSGRNIVSVTIDDKGNFKDNYFSMEIKLYCEKLINNFISSYLGTNDFYFLSKVNSCKIEMSKIKNDNLTSIRQ